MFIFSLLGEWLFGFAALCQLECRKNVVLPDKSIDDQESPEEPGRCLVVPWGWLTLHLISIKKVG